VLAELDDDVVARLVSISDLTTTTGVLRALMDLGRDNIEI